MSRTGNIAGAMNVRHDIAKGLINMDQHTNPAYAALSGRSIAATETAEFEMTDVMSFVADESGMVGEESKNLDSLDSLDSLDPLALLDPDTRAVLMAWFELRDKAGLTRDQAIANLANGRYPSFGTMVSQRLGWREARREMGADSVDHADLREC